MISTPLQTPRRRPRSAKAVASTLVGLLGLLVLAVLPPAAIAPGALAIVLGASAHSEPGYVAATTRRFASAGLLLGALAIAAGVGLAILALSSS